MSNTTNSGDTKDQIIKTADYLLRKLSYNSFSYKDISDEVGIKKSSIHYHFQTKDVLGKEVIRNYQSKLDYLTDKLDKSTDDPLEKLDAYFNFFQAGLKNNLICPGLVLSVEFFTLQEGMQEELTNLFDYYLNWLSDILKEGTEKGIFHLSQDYREEALFIISSIEGALIYARAYQLEQHYKNVVNRIKASLLGTDQTTRN